MANPWQAFVRRTAAYFDLEGNATNFETEFKSGLHSFSMTMYVLFINAQLLKHAGVDPTQTVVTTCLTAFIGTFFVGFFGNLPFIIAPGLGVTSYLAYYLVMSCGMDLTAVFTCAFVASLMAILLSLFGVTEWFLKGIPQTIKTSLIIGLGIGLASIALETGGFVQWISTNISEKSSFFSPLLNHPSRTVGAAASTTTASAVHQGVGTPLVLPGYVASPLASPYLTLIGIILATALFQYVTALPLTILLMTIVNGMLQSSSLVPELPQGSWVSNPRLPDVGVFIDFSVIGISHWMAILGFLFASISDISGVMHGLARQAGFAEPGQLNVPSGTWGYLSAATASAFASCVGCSPAVVYVESGAGIERGGRTGLTALVTAAGFFISMWFAPIFGKVPEACTAPVLFLAGASMVGQFQQIPWPIPHHAVSAFVTIIIVSQTFSLSYGLFLGCFVYVVLWLCAGGLWAILPSAHDIRHTIRLAQTSQSSSGESFTQGTPKSTGRSYGTNDEWMKDNNEEPHDSDLASPVLRLGGQHLLSNESCDNNNNNNNNTETSGLFTRSSNRSGGQIQSYGSTSRFTK